MIELKNVWKVYTMGKVEVPALRGVSLRIKQKDYVSIMGPSGSGKSTLMHMIGLLDTPTKGTVLFENKDVTKMKESKLASLRGKKIGFIFQTFNLIQTMNAVQNVELPMIFQGVPAQKRRKRAIELLEQVGLSHRIDHKPTEMSGGERQRVAIARALANDPELILADEPTGNLDSKSGEQIINILSDLNKAGKTVLIVTHDPNVTKKSRKVIKIKDGRLLK